ncbi:MAG: outer membrane lipoprotein chaperone LolA [Gammaproteobacteria bacterium]|nr:MAG: outer membrane lipoprotein chaperone LolA [Gammaproteobacteria bacterium]
MNDATKIISRRFLTVLLLMIFIPLPAYAGTGMDRLEKFFREVQTVTADFTQTVKDAENVTLQETSGKMIIRRPNRFRWDYLLPYQQLIVSDGNKVWLYDMDLEQVTVQSAEKALKNSPAMLLSGNRPLEESFVINELGAKDGREWVELLPRAKDSTFQRMLLAFDKNNLEIMELEDSFGQTTRLQFSAIRRNINVANQVFQFTPPKGVDIIEGQP